MSTTILHKIIEHLPIHDAAKRELHEQVDAEAVNAETPEEATPDE